MKSVNESIDVNVPLSTAYDQWTQFEDFPAFMEGIDSVVQVDDATVEWRASIGGRPVRWRARIVEQVPDERIAWVSLEGAQNDGVVTFQPIGPDRTRVHLSIEADPNGVVENIGSRVGVVDARIRGDLERFRTFVERRGAPTGAWRGQLPKPRPGTVGALAAREASMSAGELSRRSAGTVRGDADDAGRVGSWGGWASQAHRRVAGPMPDALDLDEQTGRSRAPAVGTGTLTTKEGSFATGNETAGSPHRDVVGSFATGLAAGDSPEDDVVGSFATGIADDGVPERNMVGSFATGETADPDETGDPDVAERPVEPRARSRERHA